jgi:two-component system sensor histidine kinase/response regulator
MSGGSATMANIRIIDDDVEYAQSIAVFLQNKGHTVSLHDDTEGMAEEMTKDKPDLLILDVMFPENPAAGFDLAREIRNTEGIQNLPIIMLTAVNQEFPMDFSAGDIDSDWMPVQDFLEKPIDMQELLDKITMLLPNAGK